MSHLFANPIPPILILLYSLNSSFSPLSLLSLSSPLLSLSYTTTSSLPLLILPFFTAKHLKYLDQIGETYFGLKVNPASDIGSSGSGGGGGIMDGLFSMLSGDTGETGQALGGLGEEGRFERWEGGRG